VTWIFSRGSSPWIFTEIFRSSPTPSAAPTSGALYRTLRSTNMIENLNGLVGHFTRNVRRWRNGAMLVRWIGAAIDDAQGRFRKLRGYRDLAALIRALDHTAMDSRKEVA
jgi:hypothetical protein